MGRSAFLRNLERDIEADGLFDRDARIAVGVSGGPDSMVLLHALVGLNQQCDYNLELHVAHLNHALRGDQSDTDAAFTEAAADALRLPRTVEVLDATLLASASKGSMEEVARRERYAFFERTARSAGASYIALGHHADDNVETILHRILRGTGLRGVCGIPAKRAVGTVGVGSTVSVGSGIDVVRPLLSFSRREILEFAADQGIAYQTDATNETLDVTRNKIRNRLLPQIETEFNPRVRDALLRLGEQARWADRFIHKTAEEALESLTLERSGHEIVLDARALADQPIIVQTEAIRCVISAFRVGERNLSFEHLKAVAGLTRDSATGKEIALPGRMTARIAYDRLTISLSTDQPDETMAAETAVAVPGRTVSPSWRMWIECDIVQLADEPGPGQPYDDHRHEHHGHDRHEEWLDSDAVSLPLLLRSRRQGDRFWPLGAPGLKDLSDFLCDAKIDAPRRSQVPVLCDQRGIVWVVGHRIDDRVKLTTGSRKALRVRVGPLDE